MHGLFVSFQFLIILLNQISIELRENIYRTDLLSYVLQVHIAYHSAASHPITYMIESMVSRACQHLSHVEKYFSHEL